MFKYLSFALLFFVLVLVYFSNHSPFMRIYYSSWEEVASNLPYLVNQFSD